MEEVLFFWLYQYTLIGWKSGWMDGDDCVCFGRRGSLSLIARCKRCLGTYIGLLNFARTWVRTRYCMARGKSLKTPAGFIVHAFVIFVVCIPVVDATTLRLIR
jgi:hypothetical protein